MAEIIIIVAVAKNGIIGKDGKMPWHLPSDLRHFKETTMGFPLIMGRKTYESIGKPLPWRDNIVLTRDTSRSFPGCVTMHSLDEALEYCKDQMKVFVIGGADIFISAMPIADTLIITALEREYDGDVSFPEIDPKQFKVSEHRDYNEEEPYAIIHYERISD